MTRLSARLDASRFDAAFSNYYRFAEQRNETAALIATDRGSRISLANQRGRMQGAGLGRLGNALGASSDLSQGRGVHRYPNGGFSASGVVFVRSQSERTLGAIEAYTSGADIQPRKGRWLWIATDEVQRLVGSGKQRRRLTPALWTRYGLDAQRSGQAEGFEIVLWRHRSCAGMDEHQSTEFRVPAPVLDVLVAVDDEPRPRLPD